MTAFARRINLLTAITDVMGELGLDLPGTVINNPDKTVQQFWRLLNRVGQNLAIMDYKWQFLTAEHTITTAIGNPGPYPLPDDFGGYITDAGWNRTTRLPVIGALEQYEWQMLKARLLSGTSFTMLYVINDGGVLFYNTPVSVQTIVIAYTSRGWCTALNGTTYQDTLQQDTDVILYDPQLAKAALRLAWYEIKQFDTTKIEAEYRRTLAAAKGADAPGRTLSLAGKNAYPYLGTINVPDTGYGS